MFDYNSDHSPAHFLEEWHFLFHLSSRLSSAQTHTFLMFHNTWYPGNYRMQEANTCEWANANEWQTYTIVHKFYHKNLSMNMHNYNVQPLKKVRLLYNINIKCWENDIKNVCSRSCLVCINHSVSYVQEMSEMKQFFFHLIFQNEWYVIHVVMGELLVLNNHKKIFIPFRRQLVGAHAYITLPTKEHWSKRYS